MLTTVFHASSGRLDPRTPAAHTLAGHLATAPGPRLLAALGGGLLLGPLTLDLGLPKPWACAVLAAWALVLVRGLGVIEAWSVALVVWLVLDGFVWGGLGTLVWTRTTGLWLLVLIATAVVGRRGRVRSTR